MRRSLLLVIALAAVGTGLMPAPTVAGGGGGCHGKATEATASRVELRKACFTPTVTRVDPGQQVAFVNRDGFTHNIVGFGALWADIEGFGYGETRLFRFDDAGVYPYSCTLHPGMVGAVVVGGDDRHAGDAETVVAGSSAGSGGPGGTTSAGARESDGGGSQLPETMLALALVVVLVGGLAGFVLRRRKAPAGV